MTNMSIQPLWLTHYIEILLDLEFQLTKFIVGTFFIRPILDPKFPLMIVDVWFQIYIARFLSHYHRLIDHILVVLICFVLNSFASTQVNYQSLVFQISTTSRESYQPLWSICSGYEPFRQHHMWDRNQLALEIWRRL